MLGVTLIQTELDWENTDANLARFGMLMDQINGQTDLVVLPEMFTTGFSMHPELFAETMDGKAITWMQTQAAKHTCAIAGSLMMQADGRFVNRLCFVHPDGHVDTYDKKHLFSPGDESKHYTAGNQQIVFQYKNYSILPVVCYDLRFPVWLRRTPALDYDLMLVVANWPERRSRHWKILLQARAVENQCVVVAVNRIGQDGNGVQHTGDSSVINAKGEILLQKSNTAFVQTLLLDKAETLAYRNAFQVSADADAFSLK